MIFIGEYNNLKVSRETEFGFYLEDEDKNSVLLPKGSLDGKVVKLEDEIEVFIYRDTKDRTIATLKKPLIKVGDVAYLKVVQNSEFGSFADMGLERDILIPIKEQKFKLVVGKSYLLYAYVDKTGRIAATTYMENFIKIGEGFEINQEVEAITYGKGGEKTIRVAVDGKYQAIILGNEHFTDIYPGDKLSLRIKTIYPDGVLGLSSRGKRLDERDALSNKILSYLEENGGSMPYNDKSAPEDIREKFQTSKNYFKMALGGLMKEGVIEQSDGVTKLKNK